MKIIKTAAYEKLSQNVMTPELEDEFVDEYDATMRKRRELGLGRKPKGIGRKDRRRNTERVDVNMDDSQWEKLIQKKEKEESEKGDRYQDLLIEKLKNIR